MKLVVFVFLILFSIPSISVDAPTTGNDKGYNSDFKKFGQPRLDDKARGRVKDAFMAIIQNDDKKAKLAYGRAHRFMPESVQLAFDLRFRNFERILEIAPKLPYSSDEKEFWKTLSSKKPTTISKYVCDWFKETKFAFGHKDTESDDGKWANEFGAIVEAISLKRNSKPTEIDAVLEKYNLHKEVSTLSVEAQMELLNDQFLDKVRNAQRKDTRFFKDSYRNLEKLFSYQPYFKAQSIFNFYLSLEKTDNSKKGSHMRRLKGIIKDMRENSLGNRILGSQIINDKADFNKAIRIGYFVTRYPLVSAALRFEFSLNDCDYVSTKE